MKSPLEKKYNSLVLFNIGFFAEQAIKTSGAYSISPNQEDRKWGE
jgi:hypothetical protein